MHGAGYRARHRGVRDVFEPERVTVERERRLERGAHVARDDGVAERERP